MIDVIECFLYGSEIICNEVLGLFYRGKVGNENVFVKGFLIIEKLFKVEFGLW